MDEDDCTYLGEIDSTLDQDRDVDMSDEITLRGDHDDSTGEPNHSSRSVHVVESNCKDTHPFEPADCRQGEKAVPCIPSCQTACCPQQSPIMKRFAQKQKARAITKLWRLKQKVIDQNAILNRTVKETTEMINLTADGDKKSIEENLQKEINSIETFAVANKCLKDETTKLNEQIDELMQLPVLDRLKAMDQLFNSIQLMFDFTVDDFHLNDIMFLDLYENPERLPLWKMTKTKCGNFKRQIDSSITVSGRRTTHCELGKHNFKFVMQKVKDFKSFDLRYESKSQKYISVGLSLTDDSPLPVNAYVKVSLVNLNSDSYEDVISKESQFNFEMPGVGKNWKQFCLLDNALENEIRAGNIFFDIDIHILLEDSI